MSEYDDVSGVSGQVENESYCMKKSFNARNTEEMNMKMGYHNMSDLANTPKAPTKMEGAKRNEQMMAKMPGDNDYDYNKDR